MAEEGLFLVLWPPPTPAAGRSWTGRGPGPAHPRLSRQGRDRPKRSRACYTRPAADRTRRDARPPARAAPWIEAPVGRSDTRLMDRGAVRQPRRHGTASRPRRLPVSTACDQASRDAASASRPQAKARPIDRHGRQPRRRRRRSQKRLSASVAGGIRAHGVAIWRAIACPRRPRTTPPRRRSSGSSRSGTPSAAPPRVVRPPARDDRPRAPSEARKTVRDQASKPASPTCRPRLSGGGILTRADKGAASAAAPLRLLRTPVAAAQRASEPTSTLKPGPIVEERLIFLM